MYDYNSQGIPKEMKFQESNFQYLSLKVQLKRSFKDAIELRFGHKIIDVNNGIREKILQLNSNLVLRGIRVIQVSFKEDMCDNVVRSSNNVTSTDNCSQNKELPSSSSII